MTNIQFNKEYRLQVVEVTPGVWTPLSSKKFSSHFVDGFNGRPFTGRYRRIQQGSLESSEIVTVNADSDSYHAYMSGDRLRQRFNRGEMYVREDGMLVVTNAPAR